MDTLIDDHILASIAADDPPKAIARARHSGSVWTTGYWYYRLCRAVSSPLVSGALSAPLADLPPETRLNALSAIVELPPDIGLLSLRDLAPVMARLAPRYRLNILNLEVVATALSLGAEVHIVDANLGPKLVAALDAEKIRLVRHPI